VESTAGFPVFGFEVASFGSIPVHARLEMKWGLGSIGLDSTGCTEFPLVAVPGDGGLEIVRLLVSWRAGVSEVDGYELAVKC
jgi:hypothetical protein